MKEENYEALVKDLCQALRFTQDEGYFDILEKIADIISITTCRSDFSLYLSTIPSSYFFCCDEEIFTTILKRDVAHTVEVLGKEYSIEEYIELSKAITYRNETMMTDKHKCNKLFAEIFTTHPTTRYRPATPPLLGACLQRRSSDLDP
ncbi:hypothetical protein L1887_49574 [Cichorium endivia]|nr:hypothetical protein L1887_49574 [Cichorium endivia]